ncbi:transmembrane protein 186 [Rhinophrynus dorsalis]
MAQLCVMSTCFRSLHLQLPLRIWRSKVFYGRSALGCMKILNMLRKDPSPVFVRVPSRSFSDLLPSEQKDTCDSEKFTLIYKFPGIRYCRALSRLKLLQTTLTVVFLPPIYYYYLQGQVTYSAMVYSTGTAIFAAVMLYCLSYYLRRIIGMMYLNANGTILKVSHLTFWGKRRDFLIPVEDVKTLADTGDSKHETILQFKRYNSPDVLYFTTRFGHILDRERFLKIFGELK